MTGALALALLGVVVPSAAWAEPDALLFADPIDFPAAGLIGLQGGYLDAGATADLLITDDRRRSRILLGDGAGSYEPVRGPRIGRDQFVLADLDGNSLDDLLVVRSNRDRIEVRLAEPGPRFGEKRVYRAAHASRYAILLADLDADGDLDVVACDQAVTVLANDGTGGLTHASTTQARWYSPVAADFDLDGLLDIAASTTGQEVVVARGLGDLAFADPVVVHETVFLRDYLAEDFDADGNPDLAFLDSELHTVTVRLGRGDGTFGTRISTPVGNPNGVMDTADFDHDGAVDVVVPVTQDDGVTVIRGRGNGRFRDPVVVGDGRLDDQRQLVDVDGDGWIDIVLHDEDAGLISTLINLSGRRS